MTINQFLLLFYYAFSVLFQIGVILADDNAYYHPRITIISILAAFITAPFFFPMDLGAAIKKM